MEAQKNSTQYQPYEGPGGPTQEQADNNTRYLGQLLNEAGIPFEEDRDYAKELWDGDDLNLKITNKKGEVVYAGYDRWGFVVEGHPFMQALDQEDVEITLTYIKSWYSRSQ
jgi:hypothetical protein